MLCCNKFCRDEDEPSEAPQAAHPTGFRWVEGIRPMARTPSETQRNRARDQEHGIVVREEIRVEIIGPANPTDVPDPAASALKTPDLRPQQQGFVHNRAPSVPIDIPRRGETNQEYRHKVAPWERPDAARRPLSGLSTKSTGASAHVTKEQKPPFFKEKRGSVLSRFSWDEESEAFKAAGRLGVVDSPESQETNASPVFDMSPVTGTHHHHPSSAAEALPGQATTVDQLSIAAGPPTATAPLNTSKAPHDGAEIATAQSQREEEEVDKTESGHTKMPAR